ncbi:hypothetical protein HMH01_08270 [Halovulum dunhuangense]|uniref:Uncharacterized protein n=1 Tax=Halovulum dunhuangense TaxID=1505036 RepID=A0A849L2G4_9RHOB|nr:hypothetical protein [Halovulum dunhuangense]NNU80434.1 hypothetical protein [Halovulum dunhuangense]
MLIIHRPIETKPALSEQEFYEMHGNACAVLFYRLSNTVSGPARRRSRRGITRQGCRDRAADCVGKRQTAP